MYMKTFYNTWCVHLVIATPVMSRSQFLHPGGGVQKWHQNTPRPRRSRGGSENHPQTDPPRGGGGYLNNRYFGGAYQGVGVKNFGPPGGVRNDPFWDPPKNDHF